MEPSWVAAATSAVVAIIAFVIAFSAYRAMLRTGNRNITYVAFGFALIGLKNAVKAYHLTLAPESLAWEVAFSLIDLAAVLLIVWPLLPFGGRSA